MYPCSYQDLCSDPQALARGRVVEVYFVMRRTYDQVSPLAIANCFLYSQSRNLFDRQASNLRYAVTGHESCVATRTICSILIGNAETVECCKRFA